MGAVGTSFTVAPPRAAPFCTLTVPRRAAAASLPVFGVAFWAPTEKGANMRTSAAANPNSHCQDTPNAQWFVGASHARRERPGDGFILYTSLQNKPTRTHISWMRDTRALYLEQPGDYSPCFLYPLASIIDGPNPGPISARLAMCGTLPRRQVQFPDMAEEAALEFFLSPEGALDSRLLPRRNQ